MHARLMIGKIQMDVFHTLFDCYHTALYFGENNGVKDKIVT